MLINDALEVQDAYNVFLVAVPYIYIVAMILYTMTRARNVENPIEKRRHLYIGLFPLMVIAGGDKALVIIADSLRQVISSRNMPVFLGRYGGDEFILIVHPGKEDELGSLIKEIRSQIEDSCRTSETPYILSVGVGYDELKRSQDTIQKCIQRADKKLYQDKAFQKMRARIS